LAIERRHPIPVGLNRTVEGRSLGFRISHDEARLEHDRAWAVIAVEIWRCGKMAGSELNGTRRLLFHPDEVARFLALAN
jgi:hypothetical protein